MRAQPDLLEASSIPSAELIAGFLQRIQTRAVRVRLVEALAIGALFALALYLTLRIAAVATPGMAALWAVLLVCAALAVSVRPTRAVADTADLVERKTPDFRNVLITAVELIANPGHSSAYIRARIFADAWRRASGVDPRIVVPANRARHLTIGAVALWLLVPIVAATEPEWLQRHIARGMTVVAPSTHGGGEEDGKTAGPLVFALTATIEPPGYSGRPRIELRNPDRIEALEGSLVRVTARSRAGALTVRSVTTGTQRMRQVSGDTYTTDLTMKETGYLAIEPGDARTTAAGRRLISIVVQPDRPPRVEIPAPGRDLVFPDSRRTVRFAVTADDDFGVAALGLRFTQVSGSGEKFDFTEGEIPLPVVRTDARRWSAQVDQPLAALGLEDGDLLVYRAVARDARGGDAGEAASETFYIEIARPGAATPGDFALPDQKERYALSQQMIILKTERLQARRQTLSIDAFTRESMNIAAEQRMVRSEFVFLLGGEVEDEEQEAEQSHEIQEGRLEARGQRFIADAINFMTQAGQRLAGADTIGALPLERAALKALQQAFDRRRYILRAMPTRSRIDLSRRLRGDRAGAGGWRRAVTPAETDARIAAARTALQGLVQLSDVARSLRAGDRRATGSAIALANRLAEDVLSLDPSSEPLRAASARLADAADALIAGRTADVETAIAAAAPALIRAVGAGLPAAGDAPENAATRRLREALSEEGKRQRLP